MKYFHYAIAVTMAAAVGAGVGSAKAHGLYFPDTTYISPSQSFGAAAMGAEERYWENRVRGATGGYVGGPRSPEKPPMTPEQRAILKEMNSRFQKAYFEGGDWKEGMRISDEIIEYLKSIGQISPN